MNFDFLKDAQDFKKLYGYCKNAELSLTSNPSYSVISARNALESLVKSFYITKYGAFPENDSLFELIEDGCFSSYLDDSLLSCIHFVRKVGNNGAHGEDVSKKDAFACLEALFETVKELLNFLGATKYNGQFDKTVYENTQNILVTADQAKSVEVENVNDLAKYKENISKRITLKSSVDFTEAETRELYIDQSLKEAGWSICHEKGVVRAGMACVEIKLEGMPNNQGFGFADYILFDDDGKPLAVVEAKKTAVDEIAGSQQAKLYADCIERKFGVRPIIFYTNGYTIKIIDNAGYPDRKVYGYYTKDELHSLIIRRNLGQITDTRINPNISDRYFIQNACTAVCESLNQKHRKVLIVMATGTGKTRCAISIVDVLQKFNWAKHVLFLADRTALVNQAKNAFTKYLGDSSVCVLSQEREQDRDYNARITFSTYQTMINMIDCEDKKYGIAAFDLIVVDECHRSVYNKYKAIFNYFDSIVLGLTATPREQVDSSTYELFELPKGEPTFAYDYDTAVKEGFLVNFHAFERTTELMKNGLKYDKLSAAEKEQYENLFEDSEGNLPAQIDGAEFRRRIMNLGTIDKVIQTVMNEGMKVNAGEKLGKTIIFATNHNHAKAIVDRFRALYPDKGPNYCKLIDNYVNYAQTLIDEFSQKDSDFTIAVSVDMMDTGIDVPEVVNLVFFKRVFSKIKFWQMIGRGTRTCKELHVFSPDRSYFEENNQNAEITIQENKQGFYIFDFCDVFEFFRMHPDGKEAKNALNISQKIFNLKLDIVCELQKNEHQENLEHKEFYEKYKAELLGKIKNLNRNLINVRSALKYVDKYSVDECWDYVSLIEAKEIKKQITPLIDANSDNEQAKWFDLWLFNMELQEIIGENDYSKAIQKVTTISAVLLDKTTIPAVAHKKEFLKETMSNEFWSNITLSKLEKVRLEIRDLVQFLEREFLVTIESNFSDSVIEKEGGNVISPQFKNYKQRVIDYLSENSEYGAVYKIKNLIPLTQKDIAELSDILCHKLGTQQDYDNIANGLSFGVFVRKIVGLEKEAVTKVLSTYLSQYNFNAKQQEFLQQVVHFVLQNGDIFPNDLYESSPFKQQDYDLIFENPEPLYRFITFLHNSVNVAVA